MDPQSVFNFVVGISGALGGWTLKIIYDSIIELRKKDEVIERRIEEVQAQFLRRDDFRDFAQEIRTTLVRIETKIDTKADKANRGA